MIIQIADTSAGLKKYITLFTPLKETVILKKYEDIYLLELFHGPTLAFKDIALQVIGNMYEKFLLNQKNKINSY